MKKIDWANLGLVFAIICTGLLIALSLKELKPINTGGNTSVISQPRYGDFLDEIDAAEYLAISFDDFSPLLSENKLEGTYTEINGHKIFSREKLHDWLIGRINNDK